MTDTLANSTKLLRNADDAARSSVEASAAGATDIQTEYRSLTAPSESGGTTIDPPLVDAELLLKHNLAHLSKEGRLQGENQSLKNTESSFWSKLRQSGRLQLVADSKRYTSAYRDVSFASVCAETQSDGGTGGRDVQPQPIAMAGHQPTLFHPGVWFKNFALQRISDQCGALAINLVIDNDVASGSSVRVPIIDSLGRTAYESVSYDTSGGGVPYEQAVIRDQELFDTFDQRVSRVVRPLVANPCVSELWKHARSAIARCGIAGCALAQARHRLEADLGWNTLEIPLGVAVRGLPFARFVMELIDDIERFQQVYNQSAEHYRHWHGIRSSAHPVPNLAVQDGWMETPLWVYGNDSPVRRGLWVKRIGDSLHLSDRHTLSEGGREIVLPLGNREAAAEQLAELNSAEFKMRPRALITTMFARLVLSDLFLHGIGGGKYDQLADRIIHRFFNLDAPKFQVVSGTIRLPGQNPDPMLPERVNSLQTQIRASRFHGERLLDVDVEDERVLMERKRRLLAEMPAKGHRSSWHKEIERVNSEIAQRLSDRRRNLTSQLAEARNGLARERILASREHPFCLFPLDFLQDSFRQMA